MNYLRKKLAKILVVTLGMACVPTQVFAAQTTIVQQDKRAMRSVTTSGGLAVTTPSAIHSISEKYIGDGYQVEMSILEKEKKTFKGKIEITNTGGYGDINEWAILFNMDHPIVNIQDELVLEQIYNECILKGNEENDTIEEYQTVEVIFEAEYSDEIQLPTMYFLDEEINYEDSPEDELDYIKWKENILKKEKRRQNTINRYERDTLNIVESTTGSVSNEYVKFNYLDGRYGLFTTGGNPDNPYDDNQKLLYGTGSTSYTTVRIDGMDYKFVPDVLTRYEGKIVATKRIGDIIIAQHISIIPNQYTGRDDVVEFFYTAENTSDIPHDVGVRIMFDTMLGTNDAAPFRLPAVGDVTTETDLRGDEIPEFWQVFDNLTNPTVIAQGTLNVDEVSTPDRVRFTNWGSASGNPWDYVRQNGMINGDSAVCLYWNEETLNKDDTLACKTFYGLSALQQDLRPPLALALTGTTKLEVVETEDGSEVYSPNPFTITAYVENIGTGTAINSKLLLDLPKGMKLVKGSEIVELGDLQIGSQQHMVSWQVEAEPSSIEKVEEYGVTIVADNAEAKTLKREITIPKIQTSEIKLLLDRESIKDGNTLNLKFKIVNEGVDPIDLSDLHARYYYTDESPKVTKQLKCDFAQLNNPYGSLTSNVVIDSFQNISPLREDANAYIEFGFEGGITELSSGQEAIVSARVNNETWSKMVMSNDYSFLGEGTDDESGYILWEYMPVYHIDDMNEPLFGIEPAIDNSQLEPELLVEFKPSAVNGKNFMNLGIRITNTSLVPIDLGELSIKYYYTNDEGHPQSVAGHYIGGRIDNKWPNITDKSQVEVLEMEQIKQFADTYVQVTFDKDAGTLAFEDYVELNLQVYNTNWVNGEYTLSNDHSYRMDEVSTLAMNPQVDSTPGMTEAGNIVVAASWWPWNWGKEPEELEGTIAAFKVGQGSAEANAIGDYYAFVDGMQELGLGFSSRKHSAKENINQEISFNQNNQKAILEADIAYISTHGWKGGVLSVNTSAKDGMYDYQQVITADKDILEWQNSHKVEISPANTYSLNMKDNQDKGWSENLKWLVFGACSQLNNEVIVNDNTTVEKWVDVMINNSQMNGIVGYYGSGPGTNSSGTTDEEVMTDFISGLNDGKTIKEAWIEANKYYLGFTAKTWGVLVKDTCEDYTLSESLNSNGVDYEKIYLFTKEYEVVEFENDESGVMLISSSLIEDGVAQLVEEYIRIEEINVQGIEGEVDTRATFNKKGECINTENMRYVFSIDVVEDSSTTKVRGADQKRNVILEYKDGDLMLITK